MENLPEKDENVIKEIMVKKAILVVEDDAVVRDMIKTALEKKYTVFEASLCSEAVKHLCRPIDLALIDYMLPDGNGFDVLKTIRGVKPGLPSIIMTGFSSDTVAIRALRTGATDYIKKPLSLAYLRKKVSDILGEKNIDDISAETANRDEFIMDCVAAQIEERYMEDLTREKIAGMVCMNRNKFCNIFKKRFGQTFKSYLNHIRIKNAAILLGNNELTVTEVASSVGYKNIVHFERIFKKIYGISPRKYRKGR